MFRYFSIRCFCLWCEKSFHKLFHLFGELWLLPTLLFVVVFVGCIFIKSSFVRTSFVVTVVYLESMETTTTTTKNRYVHMYGCRWKFNLIWFDLRFLRTTAHKFMYVCVCVYFPPLTSSHQRLFIAPLHHWLHGKMKGSFVVWGGKFWRRSEKGGVELTSERVSGMAEWGCLSVYIRINKCKPWQIA